MRVVTWNINSVRLRIDLVTQMIDRVKPDVLCLQETKTPDEFFPLDALKAKGFAHAHIAGMKGYNGVCILSKFPLADMAVHKRCGKADTRHISATVKGKGLSFELHNIYIPAGGYEPDPVANEKFKHKLDFVDELTKWFPKTRDKKDPVMILGDLNIAPLEHDVWDHKKMLSVVSHTPEETTRFEKLRQSLDFTDAARKFVPASEKLYSWWSYRAADWNAADKGRRLDHIWVTPKLSPALKGHETFRDMRGWERPSDHVPVAIDIGG